MPKSYFSELRDAAAEVVGVLSERKVDPGHLVFGGPGMKRVRKPTVPTDARSEFLANRAMGDWAEDLLAGAVQDAYPDKRVLHFGSSERMAAGDAGFKEFYLGALEEVRLNGKRPDLLIVPSTTQIDADVSGKPFAELDALAKDALAAIEVRSSKVEAETYIRIRAAERAAGKQVRLCPSFTVKVEDLKIVYRWIERYKVPQSYCQVFFDSAYAINFLDIFKIIASDTGFAIENPAKSQEKATILIPITAGSRVAAATLPTFAAKEKVTRLGRHDAYVVPQGGTLSLDADELTKVLMMR